MISAYRVLEKVRKERPCVGCMVESSRRYDCERAIRTLGAEPVLESGKIEESTEISNALVLDVGVIGENLDGAVAGGKTANKKGVPVVLNVPGRVSEENREDTADFLEDVSVDVLRGNQSGLKGVFGYEERSRAELARKLAREQGCVVVLTGPRDLVVGEKKGYSVNNGHYLMGSTWGTGCVLSSVLGVFSSVEKDYLEASVSGVVCFGVAGELTGEETHSPEGFKEKVFKELSILEKGRVRERMKVRII